MNPAAVATTHLEAFASADPDVIAGWVTDDFVNEHASRLGGGCVPREAYCDRLPGFLGSFAGIVSAEEVIRFDLAIGAEDKRMLEHLPGVLPLDQTTLVSVQADKCSVEWRRRLVEQLKATPEP